MRFLLLLLIPMVGSPLTSAKTVELGFPDLAHRIKVTLPDDYDPAKKYPAIFYYHGTGGQPNTSLMRKHVDGREWIVVGMTYYQREKFTYTPETMEKELILLRSVRRNLAAKRGLDQKRCYIAGFSKGGWMTDLFLQVDPSLAGGVILGAGHIDKAKISGRSPSRKPTGKPVFIGVGRLDVNFTYGLRAVLYHRSVGARTTFESWQGIGHAFPRDGSTALQQWFSMRAHPADKLRPVALKEMQAELNDTEKLEPYAKWVRLRQLKDYSYSSLLGDAWKKSLSGKITAMESTDPIKTEAAFLSRHRKLLFQELNEKTVLGMAKINIAYQGLIQKAPNAKQAVMARHDHKRVQQYYLEFKKQDALSKEKENEKDPFATVEPKNPENKRRIPGNPLLK